MSEEQPQTPEAPAAPAAPAFDADALASQITERLKTEFQRQPQPQPEPRRAPAPAPGTDPVGELVGPYVAPAMQAARLAEESATDAVEFYGLHQDLDKDERAEIERRFKTLRANGVPFKREDIYNHYLGENIDKQIDKRLAKREEKLRVAAGQGTVGAGSPDKGGAGQVRDARDMSTPDLEKALQGSSF